MGALSVAVRPWDLLKEVTILFTTSTIVWEREGEVAQSCLTLHDPMDCSLPGSSVHGISQARVLEWVAVQFSSIAQLCLTFCELMDCSTLGFPVHHQLPELAQTDVPRVGDAIQPSHPPLSASPLAFNLSLHQGSFPISWLFASGRQSIVASVSASILLVNI